MHLKNAAEKVSSQNGKRDHGCAQQRDPDENSSGLISMEAMLLLATVAAVPLELSTTAPVVISLNLQCALRGLVSRVTTASSRSLLVAALVPSLMAKGVSLRSVQTALQAPYSAARDVSPVLLYPVSLARP